MQALNCGSGQRPFDNAAGWINLDINPKWNPDVCLDWTDLSRFEENSFDIIVNHHALEHVWAEHARAFVRESYRILKPGGSLLIFIPDIRALAERWLTRQIDDYTYIVNLMGAYMGDTADRHWWHYTRESLTQMLREAGDWHIFPFDWRSIEGADIANAWWILGMEAMK